MKSRIHAMSKGWTDRIDMPELRIFFFQYHFHDLIDFFITYNNYQMSFRQYYVLQNN